MATKIRVFPAPAGMNRLVTAVVPRVESVPRACGDEPLPRTAKPEEYDVFPAPAGMNRYRLYALGGRRCVPRACGDKPSQR